VSQRTRVVLAALVTVAALGLLAATSGPSGSESSVEADPPATSIDPEAAADIGPEPKGVSAPVPSISAPAPQVPVGPVGEFHTVAAGGAVVGTGPLRTYHVEVEAATGVDPEAFGAAVGAILADPRSWIGDGSVSFQRVPSGGSITVTLATPGTTDEICLPLNTAGIFSCREGDRVVINLNRWLQGTTDWDGSLDDYRAMVINHEVGHALGHGHQGCPGPGQLAPVMMQQTKGLDGCVGNPWPFPEG
jgi:hypothetical protein